MTDLLALTEPFHATLAAAHSIPALLAEAAASLNPADHSAKFWAYAGFLALVVVFLALDLGVFHRTAHEVKFKEALTWSIVWIASALVFTVFVYYAYERHLMTLGLNVPILGKPGETATVGGAEAAKLFLTGYLIEKSLSMDNVFVIALIFGYFAIPNKYQHRVLFWGIVGALLMRGVMIGIGAGLVARFSWIVYVFGGFLILTALKMLFIKSETDPSKNPIVRLVKRLYPVSDSFDGQNFFTRINGKRYATPLLLALVMVEFTDLIFAVDSIPAIFAITADPFIVFTSNIFAILGLRALYFCLAAAIQSFQYLKTALIAILLFVGVKMMIISVLHIPALVSLVVVVAMLAAGILASIWKNKRDARRGVVTTPPGHATAASTAHAGH